MIFSGKIVISDLDYSYGVIDGSTFIVFHKFCFATEAISYAKSYHVNHEKYAVLDKANNIIWRGGK